jgi:hypothetical protein
MANSLIEWIKDQLNHLKESIPEILASLFIFGFTISGIGVGILLRYFEFDGLIITFYSIIAEVIGIIVLYFILKGYLKSHEKPTEITRKKKL